MPDTVLKASMQINVTYPVITLNMLSVCEENALRN